MKSIFAALFLAIFCLACQQANRGSAGNPDSYGYQNSNQSVTVVPENGNMSTASANSNTGSNTGSENANTGANRNVNANRNTNGNANRMRGNANRL